MFCYRLIIFIQFECELRLPVILVIESVIRLSYVVPLCLQPEQCDYHEAIADAERKLGISSNLLR